MMIIILMMRRKKNDEMMMMLEYNKIINNNKIIIPLLVEIVLFVIIITYNITLLKNIAETFIKERDTTLGCLSRFEVVLLFFLPFRATHHTWLRTQSSSILIYSWYHLGIAMLSFHTIVYCLTLHHYRHYHYY